MILISFPFTQPSFQQLENSVLLVANRVKRVDLFKDYNSILIGDSH